MKRKGFTLLETVLAMALAAFFAYAGSISFNRLVPKFHLQRAVWEIESSLNQARFKSIWRGAPVRVRFEDSAYRLEFYDSAAKTWRLDRAGRLEGVTVEANNSPSFYPEGTVSNLATISVSNSRGAYKITIAISGRIKAARVG
jgi:prepilin-type N-terminal cleavage/methylation domain-containing protein